MNFNPFPELRTARLFLRKIEDSDCETILFLRSDPEINKFIQRPEHRKTKNPADALKFIAEITENLKNNFSIAWGIAIETEPQLVGTICLWNFSQNQKTAEVGYDLNPEFQRKGIMSEALNAVVDFGFTKLNLDAIEAYTHRDNENSKKLLEKNGFHHIADRKDADNDANWIFAFTNSELPRD